MHLGNGDMMCADIGQRIDQLCNGALHAGVIAAFTDNSHPQYTRVPDFLHKASISDPNRFPAAAVCTLLFVGRILGGLPSFKRDHHQRPARPFSGGNQIFQPGFKRIR